MVRITGAKVKLKTGEPVKADCNGNNAAIICPDCKANPVLITARPNQKGSDKQHTAECSCGTNIWMDPPAEVLNEPVKEITITFK